MRALRSIVQTTKFSHACEPDVAPFGAHEYCTNGKELIIGSISLQLTRRAARYAQDLHGRGEGVGDDDSGYE